MSIHEELMTALHQQIEALGKKESLSPAFVAHAVLLRFSAQPIEAHVQYASLEHLKQMARLALGRRFDPDAEESPSYQGDLFTGVLQEHYPTPRRSGGEPVYKRREVLTDAEVEWNVNYLRKSGRARMKHADALAAWAEQRSPSPAA